MRREDRLDPRHLRRRKAPKFLRETRRRGQTDGHRLAVQAPAIPGGLFDGMPEGMTEVQQRPAALFCQFALIRLDNARLDGTAAADDRRQIGAGNGEGRMLQPVKQLRVAQEAILDHFGHAGREFPRRQRRQQPSGDENAARLVEGTDQVLAGLQVDAGLAADRAVHHRQQRRGNLIIVDPAQIGGGGKPGQIAGHPAADRHQRAGAVQTLPGQKIQHPAQ